MKLNARDARAFFKKPDPAVPGLLIFGPDPMRSAMRRQEVIAALVGETADEEMRLTRLAGSEIRKDPALVLDAIKAQSFFPGPRVVFIEEASDAIAKPLTATLEQWEAGDANLVVTAGQLTPRSALRKLFEGHKLALSAAIYADPPSRDEIESDLARAGLTDIPSDAMSDLLDLARALDPGDFRQTVEKLSLYKLGDSTPLCPEDIANCAPATLLAELDDALDCVAEGRVQELGPVLSKLEAQGVAAVRLCIGATQHFRKLYAAASDPGGPEAGLARARPPVPYMRKDRLARQARNWGAARLEAALKVLADTDLELRSSKPVPHMALMERALIRLSRLNR